MLYQASLCNKTSYLPAMLRGVVLIFDIASPRTGLLLPPLRFKPFDVSFDNQNRQAMSILKISTLGELLELFESMGEAPTSIQKEFMNLVAGLPYGCNCNRTQRKGQAIRGYHVVGGSFTETQKQKLKQVKNVEKIEIYFNGELINEF